MNTTVKGIRGSHGIIEIDKACINMAKHIQKIAEEKIHIDTFTAHFKVDSKGKTYFLFCSFMKYTDTTQIRPITIKSSDFDPLITTRADKYDGQMMVLNKPRSLELSMVCSSCQKNMSRWL